MNFGPITPKKKKELQDRFEKLGIRTEDLKESFVKSSGAGGQKVNKTSSCVSLRHLPTEIEVKCQEARSQSMNRFLARRRLADKLEALISHKKSEAQKNREKIRRQKRKRSKRAQEKRLKEKKIVSEKKQVRKKVIRSHSD
jgi:peptide chain release factor